MLYRLSYVGTPFKTDTSLNSRCPPLFRHPGKGPPITVGRALRAVSSMERVMGIEPTPSAWKAEVLPLNYTRTVVEGVGFEPTKA